MKFITKIFVIVIGILFPLHSYADETLTISAYNWGADSLKKNNAIYTHTDSFITNNNLTGWCTWLIYYTYTYTDSSIGVLDWTQFRTKPLLRFFHITNTNELLEDKVTTEWGYIKRDVPKDRALKETKCKMGLVYDGWFAGPVDPKVKALSKTQHKSCVDSLIVLRQKVRVMENDGNDWIKKSSGKKLSKDAKRLAAWSIVKGKEKSTNFTKEKKGKVR